MVLTSLLDGYMTYYVVVALGMFLWSSIRKYTRSSVPTGSQKTVKVTLTTQKCASYDDIVFASSSTQHHRKQIVNKNWLNNLGLRRLKEIINHNERKGDGLHSIFSDRWITDAPIYPYERKEMKYALRQQFSKLSIDQELVLQCLYKWGVFSGFELSFLDEISQKMLKVHLDKDQFVFDAKDRSDTLYILASGSCEVIYPDADHDEGGIPTGQYITPGEPIGSIVDVIGWVLRSSSPRQLRIRCCEPSEILAIPSPRDPTGQFLSPSHLVAYSRVLQLLLIRLNRTSVTTALFHLGLAEHMLPAFPPLDISTELQLLEQALPQTNDQSVFGASGGVGEGMGSAEERLYESMVACVSQLFQSNTAMKATTTGSMMSANTLVDSVSSALTGSEGTRPDPDTGAVGVAASVDGNELGPLSSLAERDKQGVNSFPLLRRAVSLDSSYLSTPLPVHPSLASGNPFTAYVCTHTNSWEARNTAESAPISTSPPQAIASEQAVSGDQGRCHLSVPSSSLDGQQPRKQHHHPEDRRLRVVRMESGQSLLDIDRIPQLYIVLSGTVTLEYVGGGGGVGAGGKGLATAGTDSYREGEQPPQATGGDKGLARGREREKPHPLFQLWNGGRDRVGDGSRVVLGVGSVLGHIALLGGSSEEWYGRRGGSGTPMLRAVAESVAHLLRVPRAYHEAVTRSNPEAFLSLAERIIGRLPAIIRLFDFCSKCLVKEGGEDVIVAGSSANEGSLYVLLTGKLRVILPSAPGTTFGANSDLKAAEEARGNRDELGVDSVSGALLERGALIGAAEALSGQPFSYSIRAMRTCTLACIPNSLLAFVVQRYPSVLYHLIRNSGSHLQHTICRQLNDSSNLRKRLCKTIAIVPVSGSVPIDLFCSLLSSAMTTDGEAVKLLTSSLACGVFGRDLQVMSEEELRLSVGPWVQCMETDSDVVLYQCSWDSQSCWSRLCLSHADEVLLVGNSSDSPQVIDWEVMVPSCFLEMSAVSLSQALP